jgi:hypothetical protein
MLQKFGAFSRSYQAAPKSYQAFSMMELVKK